jgi:predicted Zn finger-like uncharacterized protein
MTAKRPSVTEFKCPNCEARYKVVRVEASAIGADREITCLRCGGPLNGREGRFILKYFLTAQPWREAGRRQLRRYR